MSWCSGRRSPTPRRDLAVPEARPSGTAVRHGAAVPCGARTSPAPGITRRHGPDLFEARVHLRHAPHRLPRGHSATPAAASMRWGCSSCGPTRADHPERRARDARLPRAAEEPGSRRGAAQAARAPRARGGGIRRAETGPVYVLRDKEPVPRGAPHRLGQGAPRRADGVHRCTGAGASRRPRRRAPGRSSSLQVEEDRRRIGHTLATLRLGGRHDSGRGGLACRGAAGPAERDRERRQQPHAVHARRGRSGLGREARGGVDGAGRPAGVTSLPGAPPARSRAPRR